MSPGTMRTVTQHEYGGPKVLPIESAPLPQLLPTEVLVRVHAAGINPVDWKTRTGTGVTERSATG
jgi:NADPH:quinone reductase-like Zn-dependent oxidoreductase